jgi:ankyrin repeat protein
VIAQMLIEMGAIVNKKDILGHSALYYAIHYKQENCVKLLLLNNAVLT